MALKAFNDLIESNSLVPILLVFRAYLYITELDALLLTII